MSTARQQQHPAQQTVREREKGEGMITVEDTSRPALQQGLGCLRCASICWTSVCSSSSSSSSSLRVGQEVHTSSDSSMSIASAAVHARHTPGVGRGCPRAQRDRCLV
jgi:hypothetical protein